MKRISIVLVFIIALSQLFSMTALAAEEQEIDYQYEAVLDQVLNKENILLDNRQYSYHLFYDQTHADKAGAKAFRTGLKAVDMLEEVDSEPDKFKYMEVLMTMLVTYEQENAEKARNQFKQDHLKPGREYVGDAVEVLANTFSVFVADLPIVDITKDAIQKSLDSLSKAISIGNTSVDVFADYYALVQDYSKFDFILSEIEYSTDGELKEAAQAMRKNMSKQMECISQLCNEGSFDVIKDAADLFFCDYFIDLLKDTPDYASDPSLEGYFSAYDTVLNVKDTYEFIKNSAMLVSNGIVGYEDIVNRYVEIEALVEIDYTLEDRIWNYIDEYQKTSDKDEKKDSATKLLDLSEALVGNRIRGEYCNYNIFNKDAKFTSWFVTTFAGKSSVDEDDKNYNDKYDKYYNDKDDKYYNDKYDKYYIDKIEIILRFDNDIQALNQTMSASDEVENGQIDGEEINKKDETGSGYPNMNSSYKDFLLAHVGNVEEASMRIPGERSDKMELHYYYVTDINEDDIDDLITLEIINGRYEKIRVFTLDTNGIVVPFTFEDGTEALFDDNHQANGGYDFYVCSNGHLHNNYSGGMETNENVYHADGNTLIHYLNYTHIHESMEFKNPVNSITCSKYGDSISEEEFKTLTADCNHEDFVWIENRAESK